ncbi:MAG: hypothetical protein IAF38_17820 [Bacteroidia bacterium]|nr:hypothetical protein [Bacteroidia bacterium]
MGNGKKIAPPGWHLPDLKEWEKFQSDLDSAAFGKILPDGSSGFNIEFGGGYSIDQVFFGLQTSAYFWLATPVEEGASWGFFVYSDLKMMGLESYNPEQGYSVRLFKDK